MRDHAHEIARMHIVQLKPRPLIQHIRIDAIGAQQRDPLLGIGAFPLQARKLIGERNDFLVEFDSRRQTILAGIGVDAEIRDHRRRHRIEGEPSHDCFEAGAGNHGRTMQRHS